VSDPKILPKVTQDEIDPREDDDSNAMLKSKAIVRRITANHFLEPEAVSALLVL